MAFPRKLLVPNEEIVLELNPHWWYLAPQVAALAGSLILGILALVLNWPTALRAVVGLLILASLGWFIPRFLKWRTTNFLVTTERCIYRSGLVSHHGIEIPLERINTVFYKQGIFERLINSGDIAIESGGETGRQEFSDIRHPERVQHAIYSQKELNENKMYDRIGAEAAAQGVRHAASHAQAHQWTPDQIERLADLRDQGLISDEEYERKRQDLLDRM